MTDAMGKGDPARWDASLVQQLRQSLGMLQVAFDAAGESMLIIDSARRIHWANQASASLLLDGVPIQLLNRQLEDVMLMCSEQGDAVPESHGLHRSQPLARQAGSDRIRLRRPAGGLTQPQRLRWQPIALPEARFLLITIQDLTPEEEALRQQKQFMTDLSHELRTPLAIVTGTLRRLIRDNRQMDAVQGRLQVAWEEVRRIHQLLEHLTLMTSLQVDPPRAGHPQPALMSLLDHWYQQLPPRAQARVLIQDQQVQELPPVCVDDNALFLVLDQLLDNAVRHGRSDAAIRLIVRPRPSESVCALELLSVGSEPPVSDDELQRWQRPFIRAEIDRDGRHVEGSGLGLPLVRQLVEAWDGGMTLTQALLPSGQTETSVTITVPLLAVSTSASRAQEGAETDPA